MPVVHIVLVKVKSAVLSNGFDELKQKCETLKDLPIAASKATEIKWGPPAYPGRNEGYNWGECGFAWTWRRVANERSTDGCPVASMFLFLIPLLHWFLFPYCSCFSARRNLQCAGLYSVFATREDYEAYRDDDEHRKYVFRHQPPVGPVPTRFPPSCACMLTSLSLGCVPFRIATQSTASPRRSCCPMSTASWPTTLTSDPAIALADIDV
jgi:hypothetical protein